MNKEAEQWLSVINMEDEEGQPLETPEVIQSATETPLINLVVPRDQEKVQAAIQAAQNGESTTVIFMLVSIDEQCEVEIQADIKPMHSDKEFTGDRYHQEAFGAAVDSDYKIIGVELVGKDLTEILFEAQVFKKVLESNFSQRPLVIVDESGIITYCNETGAEALQMFGQAKNVVGQTLKSLVSIKSNDIVDEVIQRVSSTAKDLNLPLFNCELVQRKRPARGAAPISLTWLASAYFNETADVLGVMFQLQAFPTLALCLDYDPYHEKESDEKQGYPIVQQSQFVIGIFEENLQGINISSIITQELADEMEVKLKESGTDHAMIGEFAGVNEDIVLKWNMSASLKKDDRQEVNEILLLLQILDVCHS
jgi:hypothetical protein